MVSHQPAVRRMQHFTPPPALHQNTKRPRLPKERSALPEVPLENRPVVVADFARLAVHQVGSWNHFPAKGLADGLMTKANSENGHLPFKSLEQLQRDTCLIGTSRSRRNDDPVGIHCFDRGD